MPRHARARRAQTHPPRHAPCPRSHRCIPTLFIRPLPHRTSAPSTLLPPAPSQEGLEGFDGVVDLDSADPASALEAVWSASASASPTNPSVRGSTSPDTCRRRLDPVTPMSISARYDY